MAPYMTIYADEDHLYVQNWVYDKGEPGKRGSGYRYWDPPERMTCDHFTRNASKIINDGMASFSDRDISDDTRARIRGNEELDLLKQVSLEAVDEQSILVWIWHHDEHGPFHEESEDDFIIDRHDPEIGSKIIQAINKSQKVG